MPSKKIFASLGLLLALAACGDQTPPEQQQPTANKGTPLAEPPKTCPVAPPKSCADGTIAMLDPANCTQLCPGE